MSEIIEIKIQSNAAQASKDTQGLRQQMRDLRKELDSCTVGSAEYADALKRLANVSHDYKDQQDAIKNGAGDLGTIFDNLGRLSTGLASGFSAANAVMVLMGSDTEALQKTMVKLQAGLALVQGLKGLEGLSKSLKSTILSVKSFISAGTAQTVTNTAVATSSRVATVAVNGLKNALLMAGPIAAISAVIGLITVIISKISEAREGTDKWAGTVDNLNTKFKEQNDILSRENKILEAQGVTKKQLLENQRNLAQEQRNNLAVVRRQLEAEIEILGTGEKSKSQREEFAKVNEKILEIDNKILDINTDIRVENIKQEKLLKSQADQNAKDAIKRSNERRDREIKNAKEAADAWRAVLSGSDVKNVYSSYVGTIKAGLTDIKTLISESDAQKLDSLNTYKNYSILINDYNNRIINQSESQIDNFKAYLKKELGDVEYSKLLFSDNGFAHQQANALYDNLSGFISAYKGTYNNLTNLRKSELISQETYNSQLIKLQESTNNSLNELSVAEIAYIKSNINPEYEDTQKKLIESQQVLYDEAIKLYDGYNAQYEIQMAKLDNDIREYENTVNQDYFADTYKDRYEMMKLWLDKEVTLENERFNNATTGLLQALNDTKLTAEQQQEIYAKIEQEDIRHASVLHDINNRKIQENKNYLQSVISLSTQIAETYAGLTDSMNAVSEAYLAEVERQYEAGEITEAKFKKIQERELKKQAALQISTATIQTAAGIATAWAQAMQLGPIAGPITAAAQTAALTANLAAQIIAIKTSLKSGLSGDTTGGSAAQVPNVAMTLDNPDAHQNTLSSSMQTDLQKEKNTDQRVYVVVNDITSKQDNLKTVISNSTF